MKKKLAVMALAAATLSMMAMPVYADDLVTVDMHRLDMSLTGVQQTPRTIRMFSQKMLDTALTL